MTANHLARHSKADPNWTTPAPLIANIRRCLGGVIDFDPFSSDIANLVVQARRYYTRSGPSGFVEFWDSDAIVINPPGLMVKEAWQKLCQEILAGRARRAIWIGFSVEQLCLLADPVEDGEPDEVRWARGDFHPMDFSHVMLRKRISFVREDGTTGSPSHSNYLCAPGVPHWDFASVFSKYGRVFGGPLSIT